MKNKPYKTIFKNLDEMYKCVGDELGLTEWNKIKQSDINSFAKLTQDEQWIHIDKDKSLKHSPFKNTIAHGFMILSYCTKFAYESFEITTINMGLNYGLDRVRFPSPTPSGGFIRARVKLIEMDLKPGHAKYKIGISVELKNHEKPVCVAEFLAMVYE